MVSRAFIRDISSSHARKPSLGNQEVEATSRLEQSLSSLSSRATAKATSPPSCALLGTSTQCRISPWWEEEWRRDVLKLFSDVGRHGADEHAATGTNSSRASPSHAPQFKVHLVSSHHSAQSKRFRSFQLPVQVLPSKISHDKKITDQLCLSSPTWSSVTRHLSSTTKWPSEIRMGHILFTMAQAPDPLRRDVWQERLSVKLHFHQLARHLDNSFHCLSSQSLCRLKASPT